MKDEIKKLLFDIKQAVEAIESYLQGKDTEAYSNDRMLRSAVEREFLIIGEAMNRIIKLDEKIKITAKIEIIGMRNRIVHGYDIVDPKIVLGAVENHIPLLQKEVNYLLNK